MRVPWYLVILSTIGVIALTWHLRTREMDFMKRGKLVLLPEDMGEGLAGEATVLQPKITGPSINELLDRPEPTPPADVNGAEISEISDAELGDLEAAPGLDAYREFARSNKATRLLQLSSTLRARGQFQRALLAFERVIDSAASKPEELIDAGKGVKALTPTLPRWNLDPNSEIPLTLNIGTDQKSTDALKSAALEIATLIRTHSGDLLDITPLISSGEAEEKTTFIRASLSTTGQNPSTTMDVTVTGSEDPAVMTESLALAVFSAVRIHLTALNFPAPPAFDASGTELLTQQITRLMWRDLASSLGAAHSAPLPEEISEADDQN